VQGARAKVASLTLRKTSLALASSAELRQGLLGHLALERCRKLLESLVLPTYLL
jgi:hypothetical protein